MSAAKPRVFTIAPGAPFLPTLVDACIAGTLGINFPTGGRDFSGATVYVPTRRAARALSHAFAEALRPQAVLLPRIVPLGDPADAEEQFILHQGVGDNPDLLPAIGAMDRRLLLTELIQAWQKSRFFTSLAQSGDGFTIGESFASSYGLSGDLAGLIDEFAIEGAPWHRVGGLVTETFDNYWNLTRSFLEIAGAQWPEILKQLGFLDPSKRLTLLLEKQAERLKQTQPNHPVIAAGSTGTVPATARLLAAIARLPEGAVVLPGLDLSMQQHAWDMIASGGEAGAPVSGDSHPQAALKRLLVTLSVDRGDVVDIGHSAPDRVMRTRIVAHSARAVEATDDWPALRMDMGDRLSAGLQGMSILETSDERREALGIAVALRNILERPGKTAALITPDRALAQRTSAELRRWGIEADDSAGVPLDQTALGALARLIMRAAMDRFDVLATASILNCGIVPLSMAEADFDVARETLELVGFRGQETVPGLPGTGRVLDRGEATISHQHAAEPVARIDASNLTAARTLLAAFVQAMEPLDALTQPGDDAPANAKQGLKTWARTHQEALAVWAGNRAVSGADAVAMGRVFDTIACAVNDPVLTLADYSAFIDETLRDTPVMPALPVQGRIKIWGLLEARLLTADRIILGGLNEGIWPPDARNDAFLNRSMRAQLGLSAPERRIGQSAHDFAQALGAPEVILTRAQTVEGTPMVASRFMRRLDAFVGVEEAKTLREQAAWLHDCVQRIDEAPRQPPVARPAPAPSAALQPVSLSITEIATLYRDPYAIHARHILALSPLDPLVTGVDARDRGELIHGVLEAFVRQTRDAWPDQPLDTILDLGEDAFKPYRHLESVSAFWWPMFEKTARWFVGWEAARRVGVLSSQPETRGSLMLALADGTAFRLRGRADRVDRMHDGTLAVIDYKSGTVPSNPQVLAGIEPQLPLLAALAAAGQFEGLAPGPVSEIGYAHVGREPKYAPAIFKEKDISLERLIPLSVSNLTTMLNRLRDGTQSYLSHRMPQYRNDKGVYDHLARTREWIMDDSGSDAPD